jgi:F0F1-type ATP synthase epsilon subunit
MSKQDIDFKIGADLKQFRSAMGNIDHSLKRLSGGFGALGGVIGASFAVDAIRQFASESIDLAVQAEGVKAAFDRLNDPQLLKNLREATLNTVDDLKLMQTAVQAKNFQIPMDTLAKGLEFAQRRAQDTGQSVDYMVDSFVTGLGRKSVMILDNLGISAAELRDKMASGATMAEAVGQIMDEAFAEAGDRVVTASMKIDQQRAAITNLKTEIGEGLMPVYEGFLTLANKALKATIAAPDPFAVDEKDEEALRRQLANLDARIKKNDENLKRAPKHSTYLKNVTRLEEYRTATMAALNAKLEEKKELEMIESGERARLDAEAEKERKAKALAEAIEAYNLKLQDVIPNIKKARYETDQLFKPDGFDSEKLAKQLNFDEINMELEEIAETAEESSFVFDESFRKNLGVLKEFADEVMIIGGVLKRSFEAAFVPIDELEDGETRLMRFREVFVDQMTQMAAALLATAAAALVLAVILAAVFGGSSAAGAKLFGKAGMGFGDLFKGVFTGMGGMGGMSFNGSGIGGGQGGGVQIFGRLSGADILVSSERAGRDRTRLSGITG